MSFRAVTVKLPSRLFAEIEAAARARGVTRSEIMRARLEQVGLPAESVWDRMQDLVIEKDRAPADLLSDKARLRDYGRSRPR